MTDAYLFLFALIALLCIVAFFVVRARRARGVREARGRCVHRRRRQHRLEPGPRAGSARVGWARRCARCSEARTPMPGARSRTCWSRPTSGPKASADLVARVRGRFTAGADPAALLREEILAILGPDHPLDLRGRRPGRDPRRGRQRVGQDHDDRQARRDARGPGQTGQPGRQRHLPRRRGRAARGVGGSSRRASGVAGSRRRPRRGRVRRGDVGRRRAAPTC